jgi:predicted acyl esterase
MPKEPRNTDVASPAATPPSEVRDGMWIDWDVAIEMEDGVVLRADVYRPPGGR